MAEETEDDPFWDQLLIAQAAMSPLMGAMIRWEGALRMEDLQAVDQWRLEAKAQLQNAECLTSELVSRFPNTRPPLVPRLPPGVADPARRCSLCGASHQRYGGPRQTVIAGPISICDRCIDQLASILRNGAPVDGHPLRPSITSNPEAQCVWCTVRNTTSSGMAGRLSVYICGECVRQLQDRLVEDGPAQGL